jgi:hypothetical protein
VRWLWWRRRGGREGGEIALYRLINKLIDGGEACEEEEGARGGRERELRRDRLLVNV